MDIFLNILNEEARGKKCLLYGPICMNSRKFKLSVVKESKLVFASGWVWAWSQGREAPQGALGSDWRYVCYLDYGDGFTGVGICKKLSNYTL